MKIYNHEISEQNTYVIAEIGNNHNGDFQLALQLIDEAKRCGADAVKFQMRDLASVYRQAALEKNGEDLGTEYVIDLLQRFELSTKQHAALFKYCEEKGIPYLCTPWDSKSLRQLEKFGVEAYKVASADLTNLFLIGSLIETKKPLILSTGMSTEAEINATLSFLKNNGAEFVLLHCNSTYPAPVQDINLLSIQRLREKHQYVGYSGHERGIFISIAAAALGACVIERHFTLDRTMEGPDHAASLTPAAFKEMVAGIREVNLARGTFRPRALTQGELINRENLGKSLVASRGLKVGEVVAEDDILIKSPGQGLSPQRYKDLLGITLKRDIEREGFFFNSDLEVKSYTARKYRFPMPWGIPVRYHDYARLKAMTNLKLVEFHLSYSDMELDPASYLEIDQELGFVVHAPELFSGSHLLNLASEDDQYRYHSIAEMQRVIDITKNLNEYFPSQPRPLIVANIGGFSLDAPLPRSGSSAYYERFSDSLNQLNSEGVEIIPQNMAPFPWHFGGQRYQNLFLYEEDIVQQCQNLNLRICFDVAHAKLACNHWGVDFYSYLRRLAPFIAHLHLGDASGTNGEGIQIGDGEIDFVKIFDIIRRHCRDVSFVPEIWQGHKDSGRGFWEALEKLERLGSCNVN